MDFVQTDSFHGRQVHVIVNGTFACFQGGDGGHFFPGKREIKDVEILDHTFHAHGLGDHHDIPLVQPAKDDGTHALAVPGGYLFQNRMVEYVIFPSAKGAHASCWMPSCCRKALAACCWKNG